MTPVQYLTKYCRDFAYAAMIKSIELGDPFMFLMRVEL
jgi:hypothetical protein